MSTHTGQKAKAITKAEYELLYQGVRAAIHTLETMLENEEDLSHAAREWLVSRLEDWQRLKEKIDTKLEL